MNFDNGEYDGNNESLLMILDPSGHIIDVSQNIAEMLGYEHADIVGKKNAIDLHFEEGKKKIATIDLFFRTCRKKKGA